MRQIDLKGGDEEADAETLRQRREMNEASKAADTLVAHSVEMSGKLAALIAILSNMLQYKTEKDAIKMFIKRGKPLSCMDIGKWLDYFELISTFGIVNSALLVIFTSKKLVDFSPGGEWSWT